MVYILGVYLCVGVYLPAQHHHHSDSGACVACTWKFTQVCKYTLTSFLSHGFFHHHGSNVLVARLHKFLTWPTRLVYTYTCAAFLLLCFLFLILLYYYTTILLATPTGRQCNLQHFGGFVWMRAFLQNLFKCKTKTNLVHHFGCPAWKRGDNGAPEWSVAKAPPFWVNLKRGQWFPVKSLIFEKLWRFYACLTHYCHLPTGTCTTAWVWSAWRWASIWCLHWKLFCQFLKRLSWKWGQNQP